MDNTDDRWTIRELLETLDGAGLIIVDEELIEETLGWHDIALDDQIEFKEN